VYNSTFDPNFRGQFPPLPPGQHPQTVNNTYINAQLTVEQVNIQQHQPPYDTAQYSQSQTTMNYTADLPPQYHEASPHIHIKASAPNTIQYMPIRPPPPKQPKGPPNLDFLQPWTTGGGVQGQPQPYYQTPQGGMGMHDPYGGGPPAPTSQMLNDNPQYAANYHQFQQSLYASNVSQQQQVQHSPNNNNRAASTTAAPLN
jgi:hypothetical protein